jgi:hypothetical protein
MKQRKKKLLFLQILALSCLQMYAQDKVSGIIVELTSGKKVEYMLSEAPKLAFDGKTITLTTDYVKVEYVPSEIAKVKTGIVSVSSGIDELKTTQGTIRLDAGYISLSGFAKGETVRIFNLDGSLITTYHTSREGSLFIPISSLPSGISIIKANQQTIKITKE